MNVAMYNVSFISAHLVIESTYNICTFWWRLQRRGVLFTLADISKLHFSLRMLDRCCDIPRMKPYPMVDHMTIAKSSHSQLSIVPMR